MLRYARYWRCPECGYARACQDSKPSTYDEAYAAEYRRRAETPTGIVLNQCRAGLVSHYAPSIEYPTLLDYGTGTGVFVEAARQRGYDAHGFEPYIERIERIERKHEIKEQQYHVVTAWDVIEHLDEDPQAHLSRFITRDGWLILTTPCADDIDQDELDAGWHLFKPGEHVHYFTSQGLAEYLRRSGFVRPEITYGESFVRQYKGCYSPTNIVTAAAQYEGDGTAR